MVLRPVRSLAAERAQALMEGLGEGSGLAGSAPPEDQARQMVQMERVVLERSRLVVDQLLAQEQAGLPTPDLETCKDMFLEVS